MAIGEGLTPKQEGFARAYVETGNASEAYRRAYNCSVMKQETIWKNANLLLKNTKVVTRIQELQSAAAARNEVTVDRIVQEFRKIGFSDIRRAANWRSHLVTEEDNPAGGEVLVIKNTYSHHVDFVPSDELDDATAAAIAEVSVTAQGPKIKFHNKVDALTKLGQHFGMFKDTVEITGKGGGPIKVAGDPLSDLEAARRVAFLLGRAVERGAKVKAE
jgi:phage terminase small subunit